MRAVKRALELTGNYEFRSNFWGSLVLYVEREFEYVDTIDSTVSPSFTLWQKATPKDLKELDLR
ncbi:hypothetical protein [Marinifilum flexuosum]|uniref:Uncharacterized protein n=1 Tax=Marinifilum flexuosum TaxID=1117708 RepID=A0A419X3Z3_9BACT|nr:hypothetical protein [Marinifilum flexuosum]RKE02330.1 hypothetical protein BXY64_2418 [Marinifilum flexuosum]